MFGVLQRSAERAPVLNSRAMRLRVELRAFAGAWVTVGLLCLTACVKSPSTPLASDGSTLGPPSESSQVRGGGSGTSKRAVPAAQGPAGAAIQAQAQAQAKPPEPCTGDGPKWLGDERCPKPPDWPAEAQSLEVLETAHVLSEPEPRALPLGKITRGTRVVWTRILAGAPAPTEQPPPKRKRRKRDPCPYWVNIAPAGYLCSDVLAPSAEPPEGRRQPVVGDGRFVPANYYAVLNEATPAYSKPDDVRAGVVARELTKKFMVVGSRVVDVDGVPFMKTDYGLIDVSALGRYSPSTFAGLDLRATPPPSWPFAWVATGPGTKLNVYAEPDKKSEQVRKLARREIVPVLEERDGFARIGDGEWVERRWVRVASLVQPPAEVQSGEQWLDVDLDEQVLIAYEGKAPVFATLTSTGRRHNETPPAMYRVRAKAALTPLMGGDVGAPNRYEVADVPWAIRFRKGLFIHTAYWHDAFGTTVSHGCVNVSPKDARFLFEWIHPALPEGWSEVELLENRGPIVRVRDRDQPAPAAHDYSKEEPHLGSAPTVAAER